MLSQAPVTLPEDNGGTLTQQGKAMLAVAKETLADTQDVIRAKYRVVSESTDDFVHDIPWKAIAMAALGGIIVGMLAAR